LLAPPAGRAEVVKLALAAAGVEFEFEEVERGELKSDMDHYKFFQASEVGAEGD